MPEQTDIDLLDALDRLAEEDGEAAVERALELARLALGMDVAYLSEFADGDQVVLAAVGETGGFGIEPALRVPLEETFCRRMVEGELPNAIPDVRADPRVNHMPAARAAGLGAYLGVPLRLPDGRILGSFCCASHEPHPLDERDARFLRVVARLAADAIGHEQLADELRRLRERAAATTAGQAAAGQAAPPAGGARLTLWFTGATNAAAAARQALRKLEDLVPPERLHEVALLVTELVTNSVRHAGIGPANAVGLDVVLSEDSLHVEVSDPGGGFEPPAQPTPDLGRLGGWGLYLVDQLSDRWGVRRGQRTRVWFEMDGWRAEREDMQAA